MEDKWVEMFQKCPFGKKLGFLQISYTKNTSYFLPGELVFASCVLLCTRKILEAALSNEICSWCYIFVAVVQQRC